MTDIAKKRGRPPKPESLRKRNAPKNTPVAKLLEQKALNPSLSIRKLAKINNLSQQAVSQMFKRYGVNENYLESFKEHRADILAGIQETVASTLTEADIKDASVRDRTILLGTLYDKERLERGQSTSNSHILISAVMAACEDY